MNRKIRLLLVDDEPGIVEGLTILLNAMGQPWDIVGSAEDGVKGIELVEALRPDIVITDIRMPVMDGLEMIRALAEKQAACRFIVLSGYRDFEYAKQAMAMGVRHYVTKPIDEDELAAAIREIGGELDLSIPEGPARREPIDEILAYLQAHYAEDISLMELSARFFLNPYYIGQLIKKKTGRTFQGYITHLRLEEAKHLLRDTDLMVYEISERVGYNDTAYFSKLFEKAFEMRPSDYRRQGDEERNIKP